MKKKILIIEDEAVIRENVAELLELTGYEVETASNGRKGVDKARSFQPDLIACDIAMEGLDGYGVLYILSKEAETAHIPFIFLTSKAEKADWRRGMELGASDYLIKPFEDTELLNIIEIQLEKHEKLVESLDGSRDNGSVMNREALEAQLKEDKKLKAYKQKDYLYHEGDYPAFVYLVAEGAVKTYHLTQEGKQFITGIFEAGDYLGYKSVVEDRNHHQYAQTLTDAKVYRIPREEFEQLVTDSAGFTRMILEKASRGLSYSEDRMTQLAYDSVRKRVANQILEIAGTPEGSGGLPTIAFSRSDLAGIVGTAKETLARMLAELREDNIIDTEGKMIILRDRTKLKRIAEFG